MAEFMTIRKEKKYSERRNFKTNEYKKLYRFTEPNVKRIADHFLGHSAETRGGALSSQQRMEIFLRYMADPGFQIGVGEDTGVHRTTVTKTIKFVLEKIIDKANIWIKFPINTEDVINAKQVWNAKFEFPNAVGAIDCTHIAIPKPGIDGDEYINRKNFTSINVQATCDANEHFTSVEAQWPGSVHDSRILKMSPLYQSMSGITSFIILGDSGYGITPWLMTPYKIATNGEQKYYNKIHKKERVIIERCFGQLKRRFPILKYGVRTVLNKTSKIITCCFILHNVAKHVQDSDDEFDEEDDAEQVEDIEDIEPEDYNDITIRRAGQEKRTILMNILFQMRNNSN